LHTTTLGHTGWWVAKNSNRRILPRIHGYRHKVMALHRAATVIALAVQTIGLLPDGVISVSTCYTHTCSAAILHTSTHDVITSPNTANQHELFFLA
jgi:hypothetical protein